MAKVLITESTLENIADAIRVKANTNRTYKPSEMAIAIYNLNDIHQPIEINVPQSENQTVSVNAKLFSASDIQAEHTTSFSVNFPPSIPITASVVPDIGYEGGTLNQSSLNAFWGGTINFTVTPAIFTPIPAVSIECESIYDATENKTYITFTVINNGNVPLSDINVGCEETGDTEIIPYLDVGDEYLISIAYDFEQNPLIDSITVAVNTDDPVSYSTTETFEIEKPEEQVTHTATFTLNVIPASDASNFTNLSFSLDGQTVVLDPYNDVSIQVSDGYRYDISSPVYLNYTVTPNRITGVCVNDIHYTITYERNEGMFTIILRAVDTTPISASYSGTVGNVPISGTANGQLVLSGYYGDSFSINFVPPSGYTLAHNPFTGTLSNHTVTLAFTPTGGGGIIDYDEPEL